MFSYMINAKEDRDVATEYITGYCLQTDDTSASTNLKFDGIMEEILAHIDLYLKKKHHHK